MTGAGTQTVAFDSRQSERLPVLLLADCRKPSGFRGTVDVMDLTNKGCRIRHRGINLERHQRVTLRMEGLEVLVCVVRWVSGDSAGIEFGRPLHPAVVLFIQQMHPPTQAELSDSKI